MEHLKNARNKLSVEMIRRLEGYVSDFVNKDKDWDGAYCSIVSYCSALYDCGFVNMRERVALSCYYRTKISDIECRREQKNDDF